MRHGLDMRLATAETELHEVIAARKQFEAELDTSRAAVHEITASRDELAGRLDPRGTSCVTRSRVISPSERAGRATPHARDTN